MLKTFLQKYKNDVILLGIILICAGLITAGFYALRKPGAYVRIESDSEVVKILPLDIEWTEFFYTPDGGVNEMVIHEGKVSCRHASCPDKLCVKQKSIRKNGETIVCLPARILIEIRTSKETGISDYDAVSE